MLLKVRRVLSPFSFLNAVGVQVCQAPSAATWWSASLSNIWELLLPAPSLRLVLRTQLRAGDRTQDDYPLEGAGLRR